MDSQSSFVSFLRQPSTLAELQAGRQVFGREEVQPFLARLRQMHSTEEKDAALHDLVALLPQIDSFHAGMLALLCGMLVEGGAKISIPLNPIMELMRRQLLQIRDFLGEDNDLSIEERFERFPEASRAQAALSFTLPAVMAMLCRDKEARKQWQRRQDVVGLIDELEDANLVPFFLKRTFTLLDDKDLLVLDTQNKRGFLTRLFGVQDVMYHCYALLQHALLQYAGPGYLDAEPTDPLAVRFAQNDHLTQQEYARAEKLTEWLRFDFCYPGGLFFPGSASFADLPSFQGLPFLLVAKKGTTLSPTILWGPANMYPILHEALKARVDIVRELSDEEIKDWLPFAVK